MLYCNCLSVMPSSSKHPHRLLLAKQQLRRRLYFWLFRQWQRLLGLRASLPYLLICHCLPVLLQHHHLLRSQQFLHRGLSHWLLQRLQRQLLTLPTALRLLHKRHCLSQLCHQLSAQQLMRQCHFLSHRHLRQLHRPRLRFLPVDLSHLLPNCHQLHLL
jgi:hypothetical protein